MKNLSVIFSLLVLIAGPSYAGDSTNEETVTVETIETGQKSDTLSDQASEAWQATKETVSGATQAGSEKGAEILDSTKVGVAKGADYVGTKSKQAWEATKSGAGKATDATTDFATKAWEKTKEVTKNAVDYTTEKVEDLTGDNESEPVVIEKGS